MKMLDLPERDCPRERLLRYGAETLSDRELLALLLGSGRKDCDAIELAVELIGNAGDRRPRTAGGAPPRIPGSLARQRHHRRARQRTYWRHRGGPLAHATLPSHAPRR